MRFAYLSLAVLAAAVPALPAAAQAGNQSQQQQQQNERRICRNEVDATGSILGGRRVCRTAAEWRRIQEDARTALDRANNGSISTSNNGS